MSVKVRESYKCKEVPVRNNPGICKRHVWDSASRTWRDSGKYRATRRETVNGRSKRVAANFDNFEDAKAFRSGELKKTTTGTCWHRTAAAASTQGIRFEALVREWKAFHYLQVEKGTQQTYDKQLPHLEVLNAVPVEEVTTQAIDRLVYAWVSKCTSKKRQNFSRELTLLKTILSFYRRRMNPFFMMPILRDHYRAADIAKKAKRSVQFLSASDLAAFFLQLCREATRYYGIALAQFALGLRIGEACGLMWDCIDLEKRTVSIRRTIVWDFRTWEPSVKERPKNERERTLEMPDFLFQELKRQEVLRDPSVPFVFHKNGAPLNRKTIAVAYNRTLKQLGLDHVSGTHMLRRTSGVLANAGTGDIYAVQKMLDHTSSDVTQLYVAETSVHRRKVAEALDEVFRRASGRD